MGNLALLGKPAAQPCTLLLTPACCTLALQAKLLHSVAWVFERGDIFHDPLRKEEQWQLSSNNKLPRLSSNNSMSEVRAWGLRWGKVEECVQVGH